MVDAPDKEPLLDALAAFLGRDVVGAIADPALAFRVRIAAHLVAGLARELRTEVADDRAHLEVLRRLGAGPQGAPGSDAGTLPVDPAAVKRAIREAERALAETIRTVPPADDVEFRRLAAGLRRIAARKALLGNPRFAVDPEDAA